MRGWYKAPGNVTYKPVLLKTKEPYPTYVKDALDATTDTDTDEEEYNRTEESVTKDSIMDKDDGAPVIPGPSKPSNQNEDEDTGCRGTLPDTFASSDETHVEHMYVGCQRTHPDTTAPNPSKETRQEGVMDCTATVDPKQKVLALAVK